jgi:hypothetical protein
MPQGVTIEHEPVVAVVSAQAPASASARRQITNRYSSPKGTKPIPGYKLVHQWANEVLTPEQAKAFAVVFRPTHHSRLDKAMARQVLATILPKDRPVRLKIPTIEGPETQLEASRVVYDAVRDGVITPTEALQWLDIVERMYASWLKARGAQPLRTSSSRSGRVT